MQKSLSLFLLLALVACSEMNPKSEGNENPDPAVGRTENNGTTEQADTLNRDFSHPERNLSSDTSGTAH